MNIVKIAIILGIFMMAGLLLIIYKQDLEIKELKEQKMYLTGQIEYQSSVIVDLEEYLREGNL